MSKKKHPKIPLYHTLDKKSINKPNSVSQDSDSSKTVESLCKTSENQCKTSGKTANSSVKLVENTTEPCVKTVENQPESVQNRVETSVDNLAENSESQSESCSENQISSLETSSDFAIRVQDIHKSFRLPTERASGMKQAILNWFKGVKGYTEHQVLRGVSFEIKKGEFVGIVGRNGSGKSTLLKILAQIYFPEQGTIEVNGNLVPFIELGVGFNPDLTGRENVYLNGALLGFSNKEMESMYDEIVRFAELEPFMDAKLKNYSSGMQVRLAFSIAIRARGDILILDEVLAVGDAEFQAKCNDYFASLHGNQTVILVTHSMENVRRFCDRAILIEDGKIATEGDPEAVAKAYESLWS